MDTKDRSLPATDTRRHLFQNKNKTVSIDSAEERKENFPIIDFNESQLEFNHINEFHTLIEITKRRLSLTDPIVNSNIFNKRGNNLRCSKTITKPRMAFSCDKNTMKNVLVRKIRDKLRKEI